MTADITISEPVPVPTAPLGRDSDSDESGTASSPPPSSPSPPSQPLAVPTLALDITSSDGRDSGVEADTTFTPPDAELSSLLVEAVELYFADESLLKDAFLLKHVKRNKEGFVSVKLISSFKRVKHISRDWRVVAHALRQSHLLEVNEAGTKARRLQPLPEHDETMTSRTVVAVNLPLKNPTITSVSALFGGCGDISSIRVLKPGQNVPVEVRAAFNKHPDIAWEDVNCAVVEFDLQEQAKRAIETMAGDSMYIIPIGKVSNKKKSRHEEVAQPAGREQEEVPVAVMTNAGMLTADAQKKRRQRRRKMPLTHSDSRSSLSGTDGESYPARRCSPPALMSLMAHPPPLLYQPPPLLSQPSPLLSQPSPLVSQPPPLLSQPPPLLNQPPPPLLPLPAGLVARRPSPPVGSGRVGSVFASTDIRLETAAAASAATASRPTPRQKKTTPPSSSSSGSASSSSSTSFGGPPPAGDCPWVQRRKASGALEADKRGSLVLQQNVLRAPRGPDGTSGFTKTLRRSPVTTASAATLTAVPAAVPAAPATSAQA